MTRDELLALAARVEAAPGADRELDRAVAMTAMPPARRGMYVRRHYTTSLDAALTLVPERWTRTMVSIPAYAAGVLIGDVICYLHHDTSSGGGPYVRGVASGEHAEARARTAAALRARAEEASDEP